MIILTDIEGTTTPLSFVHDCLFPYILDHLNDYLDRLVATDYNGPQDLSSYPILEALKQQADADIAQKLFPSVPAIDASSRESLIASSVANMRWQMGMDRKIAALKNFQGQMWLEGYSAGNLKGVVYQDVVESFQRWQETGINVYIYSSGSVQAQKLIFGFSDQGDLLPYIK